MILIKKYGGFLRRVIATLIDGVIFVFIPGFLGKDGSVASIIAMILDLAYNVWMVGTYGATIGKMVMSLKVIKENGSKVSYSDALLRELSKYLSASMLLLGFLWVIWDKKKQGWHDKIAKTYVIRA